MCLRLQHFFHSSKMTFSMFTFYAWRSTWIQTRYKEDQHFDFTARSTKSLGNMDKSKGPTGLSFLQNIDTPKVGLQPECRKVNREKCPPYFWVKALSWTTGSWNSDKKLKRTSPKKYRIRSLICLKIFKKAKS